MRLRFRLTILSLLVLVFLAACVLSYSREQATRARRREKELWTAGFCEQEAVQHDRQARLAEDPFEKRWWADMAAYDRAEAAAHRRLADRPWEPAHKCPEIPRPDLGKMYSRP